MTTPEPAQVVQRWLDAHNRHDVDAMVATVADDIAVRSASNPESSTTGQPAVRDFWSSLFGTFPDHRFDVLALTADGPTVIAEVTERGTMHGPLGPNRPTGRSFEVQAAFRFDVRDGRISSIVSYWDMGSVGRQLALAG